MKISSKKSLGSLTGKKSGSKKSAKKTSFSSLFAPISKPEDLGEVERKAEISSTLEEIEELGKELALRKSIGCLDKYKAKIKEVLKFFGSNAYEMREVLGESLDGNVKQMPISKVINQELIDLTREVMSQEKGNIDIASTIDNIRGILIDYVR